MDGDTLDHRGAHEAAPGPCVKAGMTQPEPQEAARLIPPEAAARRTLSGRTKSWLRQWTMRSAGRIAVGLNATWGPRPASRVGILTYHRVAPHCEGVPAPSHNVEPVKFREQIAGLQQRGYTFRPLSALLEQPYTGEVFAERTAVVTFDDGFESVYTQAFPVLQELGVPFTLFVNTAYVGQSDPFPFDAWGCEFSARVPSAAYRPLTTLQCRTMLESGLMELGAHTHTHADFRSHPEFLRQDLTECARLLRSEFGIEKPSFAFPFGSRKEGFVSEELIAAARQTGVCCALSTECGPVDPTSDPFQWGRYNAFPWDTSTTLAAKLAGWYDWAPHGWRRLINSPR